MLVGLFTPRVVERLQRLWQEMANTVAGAVLFTGQDLNMQVSLTIAFPCSQLLATKAAICEDFLLLISPEFSVCLGIQSVNTEYQLHLTFQAAELQQFVTDLLPLFPTRNRWRTKLQKLQPLIQDNDPAWQGHFFLLLAQSLSTLEAETNLAQIHDQKLTIEHQVNKQTSDLRDALVVAQSASDAKTEFLAVLSHELRTPLTSILGLSYTLLNLLNSNLDDRQKSYLQTIKHSGDHLLELIEDMIEVSKLEAGRAVLKISEFSVIKLLNQSVQILQPRADQQKVTVQIQLMEGDQDLSLDASQDIRFRGDLKRIKQVVINLLNNAIKFTEESGHIILRAWREFDYLVLQVEDTGIGIAQDRIPLIFQKFQQLDSTLDREYEGMGLGLALTKQLVELHGGWIEVESSPGSGSTFTVWLAAQALHVSKPKVVEATYLPRNFSDGQQPTKMIVVVEDDRAVSSLISDILTAAGYQVVSLSETSVTHKQIELWQPDLVIIDQQIGEEHTNQILRYLHNLRASQHIRYLLIATTGQLSSKEQVMAVDRLFWDRIQPELLLDKISRLF
jgi:two-component system, sensor histidine kinase and response regulator